MQIAEERKEILMKKNKIRRLIILAIYFVVFNVIVFVIPFRRNDVFWIAYVFSTLTLLGYVAANIVAFFNADTLKRVFMGVPIVKIAFRCLVIQLILCALLMIVSLFADIPVWVAVIPCLLILAFAVTAVIKADWAREIIEKIDVKSAEESRFMHQLRADLESLVPLASDSVLKQKVEKLSEEVRYSDPVSIPGLQDLELRMESCFTVLKQAVHTGSDDRGKLVDELASLLNERNNQCRFLRRQKQ